MLTWLRLIHRDLPALVKQRYGTELRFQTLASIKPEISQALDSLLEEIATTNDDNVLRTVFQRSSISKSDQTVRPKVVCPLCEQAGRPKFQHYLSQCRCLPEEDKLYFRSKICQAVCNESDNEFKSDDELSVLPGTDTKPKAHVNMSSSKRVTTKQSPHF